MKTIYLASRMSRINELNEYKDVLEALGYKVTSRWLEGRNIIVDESCIEEQARIASDCFTDLCMSELCISFTDSPRIVTSRGGQHVEHGIALGMMKRVFVVGPRENIFHYLMDVQVFETWEECLQRLIRENHIESRTI